MRDVVLDASVAVAWITATQATDAARRLLRRVGDYRLFVPSVFTFELRSGLLKLERRGALKPDIADEGLQGLAALPFEPMPAMDDDAIDALYRFARRERVGLFDATYIDLAIRLDIPLASRDGPQLTAAARVGAEIMDLREPSA